ncbi:MAG TPA: ABC transporter permease [Candidatus Saccharimonadales bacterium]|nr:ABC transporter permease [Candidatus Saccharimonadales bacterium]
MTKEIRAEFRKVFTTRSTYALLGAVVFLLLLLGFYVAGWHSNKADLMNPLRLQMIAQQAINALSIFPAVIAVLLFTHEFRYNTISYSLTLSNNRSKVLLAKIIAISVVALVTTAFLGAAAPLLAKLAIHINHLHLAPQQFHYGSLIWKGLMFGWGMAMAGLVIAALIRNQIGAIVTLFIVPSTIEGLLSIWLKSNTVYLPFSALHRMLGAGDSVNGATLSPLHAMFVFLAYLVVAWAIAWYLFLKRDAS